MTPKFLRSSALAAALVAASLLPISTPVLAGDGVHKVVIHIDENDPKRMNMVLNNAANINKYYQSKGEEAQIEIVAYGPGLMMMHGKKSPVAKRMNSFGDNFENVSFKACGNTRRKMSKKSGKDVPLLKGVEVVPSGAIHLLTRQEEGWTYLRP